MLTLLKAKAEYCETVFKWRNNPDVRRRFFDPRELSYAEHKTWFFESLVKEDRILLIAQESGNPVGVIRFDLMGPEMRTAEIDIYVDPDKKGHGLGKKMLRHVEEWLRQNTDIRTMVAKVKDENMASVRMFKSCNFNTDYIQLSKDL